MEVFEKDCLVVLGTCIAAAGQGKPGKPCFRYSITPSRGSEMTGELLYGELKLLPLEAGETAQVEVQPSRGFDFGNGPGKSVRREVKGGPVGLILDARGRSLQLPEDDAIRKAMLNSTVDAMDLYEQVAPVGA
jgi:hypothetical protein